MATSRTNRVEVEITASDEATPTIERLERKIDGLEADEARITVSANTERLTAQLDAARQKLDGLEGDEATVQARLVGNLETSLEQADALLRELDGKTGTVRINAVDKASKDLDQVNAKMRQLDGETAKVRTTATGIAGGVAGGIGLAALPATIFAAAQEASQLAIEVDTLAGLTGATVEDASRLAGVFAAANVESSDLADIMLNVNSVLRENPDLAKELGVDIENNTSLIKTFVEAVDGVSAAYDNAGDRAVAASTLFGEEGVRQVGAVTRALETDLGTALEEFEGPIVTEESVENARKVNAELLETKQHIQEISLALLPIINGLLGGTVQYFQAVAGAGAAVANAGGATRRFVEGALDPFTGGPSGGLTEKGVIARNTLPYLGGYMGGQNVTIVNPPGTPPATVDLSRLYDERNGSRS